MAGGSPSASSADGCDEARLGPRRHWQDGFVTSNALPSRDPDTRPKTDAQEGLSVVIPVRNGAATLGEQLMALRNADRPSHDFEVIVADNGSDDGTIDIVRLLEDQLPLRLVDASDRPGSNHARNCGVCAANFGRILLCDADDRVDSRWLMEMTEAFDAGHELVAGPIDYAQLNPPHVRAWRGAERAVVSRMLDFLPAGHGANMGFTRKLFDQLGGFDEDFGFGGEDVELFWRAQLAGAQLHFAPQAVVHYRLRQTLRGLFNQSIAYGAGEARLYSKFADHGVRRRPASAIAKELWWLVSRLPFAGRIERRGAWLRHLGQQLGRLRGALECRVWWW